MEKLFVIKIGGNVIDDEKKLSSFLKSFAEIEDKRLLVHGGGKLATQLAEQLNIPQQMVDGRRITDAETLKVVTMVYAGYINKNIVAKLQAYNCNSVGLCGADGNILLARKREHPVLDYGFVGDIDTVNVSLLKACLDSDLTAVIAPITADKQGQLLNTNADTIAQEIANALCNLFEVTLVYCFEKKGVLLDINDDNSVIPVLNETHYLELKTPLPGKKESKIFSGMLPKLDNAFAALHNGVRKVIIGQAEELDQLIGGEAGTIIINE